MGPILPLDNYRQVISYNPFHFWGLTDSIKTPIESNCNQLVTEYAWQSTDAAGRDDIRVAIERAESLLRDKLGYSVAPHYTEEMVSWPTYFAGVERDAGFAGADGRWTSIQLSEGKIISAGVEALTVIQAAAAVVFTDTDGDGVNDTFTIGPVATAVTDPAQVAVYFSTTERFDGTPVSARWRVEPVTVTITGGQVTIKGAAWLAVRPVLYQGVAANVGRSPLVAGNFVTTLDVYQRSTDTNGTTIDTAQAVLYWETAPYPWFCSAPITSVNQGDPAAQAIALARVSIRDAEKGIVGVGESVYDATTAQWSALGVASAGRPPDRVLVRTFCGDAYESRATQAMKSVWRTTVTRFAIAEAMHRISACDTANREIYRWMLDLARAAGTMTEQFRLSNADLGNPFGTRAGQIEAWRAVNNLYHVIGVMA